MDNLRLAISRHPDMVEVLFMGTSTTGLLEEHTEEIFENAYASSFVSSSVLTVVKKDFANPALLKKDAIININGIDYKIKHKASDDDRRLIKLFVKEI